MRRFAACSISFSLLLMGCGEPVEPVSQVPRGAKLVKTCPNLRSVYAWHGKLFIKDGERYQPVERTHDELCDMTATYDAQDRER
jgi:hypothetical protein